MHKPTLAVLGAVAIASVTISALPQRAERGATSASEAIRQSWNSAKKNILQSADVMPEANYSFKPVESVRSFGQILAHVAGANFMICAAAKGEKAPHAEDEFEKSATTKAAIDAALRDSFTYCDTAYAGLTDANATDTITMPFGMGNAPRLTPLMLNFGHINEHYGNLVTYFRLKGIVPPSSR
jgi:uncharacterized damage-inducible protein DinB